MWKKRTASESAFSISHPAGVAGDELLDGGPRVIGQENRRLLMAEIEDVDLSEFTSGEADLLVVDARRPIFAGGHVQFNRPPGAPREERDLLQELRRPSAQGNEGNAHVVEARQARISRQPRVKHEVAREGLWIRCQKAMNRKISAGSSPLRISMLE